MERDFGIDQIIFNLYSITMFIYGGRVVLTRLVVIVNEYAWVSPAYAANGPPAAPAPYLPSICRS